MKYLTEEILKYRNDLAELNNFEGQNYSHISSDTMMRWEENLKKEKNNPSIQYYIKYPIVYKLNNEGFRTPDDFNSNDEGNVFLGCSHTFGIGHHLENVWSYKVSNVIGDKFWNLYMGGTGVMTHFRIFLAYYKKLKIKKSYERIKLQLFHLCEQKQQFGNFSESQILKLMKNLKNLLILEILINLKTELDSRKTDFN
jgi:hypothetical protein